MVKLVAFLKRREGMTREEFYEHWEGTHGPLIRSTPSLARHIVRYEQHRRLPVPGWSGSPGFDGITIQWLESVEAFQAFCAEPAYEQLILPDEARFLDKDALVWMMTEEPMVTMDGPIASEVAP